MFYQGECMDELVKFLSEGRHKVLVDRAKTPADFRASLDDGFVLLRFPDTRGGTTLGVRLDKSRCELGEAGSPNTVRLTGTLVLNYNEIELTADLDPTTLEGAGSVTLIADEPTWRAKRAAQSEAAATAN
jgi:hypothetical protein